VAFEHDGAIGPLAASARPSRALWLADEHALPHRVAVTHGGIGAGGCRLPDVDCITGSHRREWISSMTEASTADSPPTANFINPDTMHRPTGYTHVVEVTAGRPVYIAGQVALDAAGALVGPGDIRAQARQVFDNLRAALQAVGAGFDQVVKLNYYLVDATQLPVVREVRDEYLNAQRLPASTAVEISRLFRDDLLLEVEAVAVIAPFQHISSTV
jgi:enamine deaminase RidA (YjgF/YER057c/UK114 family)